MTKLDKALVKKRLNLIKENNARVRKWCNEAKDRINWALQNVDRIDDFADKIEKQIDDSEDDGEPVLVGNSLRPILHWEKDLWPNKAMSLREHEQILIDNKINFERIDAVKFYGLVRNHCIRMNEAGITVMLTLGDRDRSNFGDYREVISATRDLNIIYDVENEFMDESEYIDIAGERAEYISNMGLRVAGGGWGNSTYGERNDKIFWERHGQFCTYRKVHRPYPSLQALLDFIEKQRKSGKEIICSELLYNHSLPCMENPEEYLRALKNAGAYAMNIYDNHLESAGLVGRLCQGFNS